MDDGAPGPGTPVQRLFIAHCAELRSVVAHLAGPGLDPDDLLQDVFVIALRKAQTFPGGAPPRAWLFGVAIQVARSARRAARVREFLGLESAEALAHPEMPSTVFERREASAQLYRLLDQLSERKRTVLVLYEIEGWKGEEIATALGCPLKTVWTRLFHARRDLDALVARTLPGGQGG